MAAAGSVGDGVVVSGWDVVAGRSWEVDAESADVESPQALASTKSAMPMSDSDRDLLDPQLDRNDIYLTPISHKRTRLEPIAR